jgi:glyoxylase-like metal-dependent hydrolase (beta-lactamase superfamily II)
MSTGFSSKHFVVHEVSENVYAAIHSNGGWQTCNSGIIDLGGSTLLFDTGLTPQSANDLNEASIQLTGKEPEYIVNSHYHNDHIRGNQSFQESIIISSSQIRDLIDSKGREEIESDKKHATQQLNNINELRKSEKPEDRAYVELFQPYWEGIITSLSSLELRLPMLTFTESLTLHGSDKTAILTSFSNGHSDNDCILFLPDERVMFCGDLLFAGCHPYLGDGYPDSWLMILDQLKEMNAEVLIPGHGYVGAPEDLALMREYIVSLMNNVRLIHEQGGSADDATDVPVPESFKDWILDRPFYSMNMRFLYKQFKTS